MNDSYTCLDCGWPAEVKYVPGLVVKEKWSDGERESRRTKKGYIPRNDDHVKEEIVGSCEIKIIICNCNKGEGRYQ